MSILPRPDTWPVPPQQSQIRLSKTRTRDAESLAKTVIAFTKHCRIVPLDTDIAIAAAKACRSHKLATADAVIFATARAHDAELLTCDRDFENLPGVIYVPKT